MTVPDCLWRPYLFFVGGILGGVILGFLGILRAVGLNINDTELILGVIGFLLIPVDIWLIRNEKSLQNVISMFISGFLLTGFIYFIISLCNGFVEAIIGLLIIVLELFIFLILK